MASSKLRGEPRAKRKRSEDGGDDGFIPLGDTNPTPQNSTKHDQLVVPWVEHNDYATLSLGDEIWNFYEYFKPTQAEEILKEYVISQLTDSIKSLWHSATVEVFGSHATKMALPTSDVDLIVYNAGHKDVATVWYGPPLQELYHELKVNHKDKLDPEEEEPIKLISSAKVPIIKLVSAVGGIKVDIMIAIERTGTTSTTKIHNYMRSFPLLAPLVIVLKQFLYQFNLHETYTGGIGSYALTLMVISLLQLRASKDRAKFECAFSGKCKFTNSDDIGLALIDFFELYGKLFDHRVFGISVRKGGKYFRKPQRGNYEPNSRDEPTLYIEDPSDIDNDVGRNSFNISAIRSVFHNAFMRLTSEDTDIKRLYPQNTFPTLLSRIIQLDEEVIERRGRAWKLVGSLIQNATTKSTNIGTGNKNLSTNTAKRKWDF